MKNLYLFVVSLFVLPLMVQAQRPGKSPGKNIPSIGHIFGRILDGQNGKPVEFATVTLLNPRDSSVITGMLTKGNGDFSLDHLSMGKFLLKVNFLGYQTLERPVMLSLSNPEQDLGNFKLGMSSAALKQVTVSAQKNTYTFGIDKKVFNVEKSLNTIGGTATDVLKQVPSVDVDIDGNVTVRNSTPTIFVDGKPTDLTLDQIPADAIATVEVITNPSAKYDASGQGGIINIVLKKNKKAGINGLIMAGAGTGDKYTGGGNLNIRQNPFNLSLNYHLFQNNENYYGNNQTTIYPPPGPVPQSSNQQFINQHTAGYNQRLFQFGQIGLDYYLDNRNTFSVEEGFHGGHFNTNELLSSHFLNSGKVETSNSDRYNLNNHHFQGRNTQLSYNHNFIKEKEQFSALVNFHSFTNGGSGNYTTDFFDPQGNSLGTTLQNNFSSGKSSFTIAQADYTDPVKKNGKFEAGVKTTIHDYNSVYNVYNVQSGQSIYDSTLSSDFSYHQAINAAYADISNKVKRFSYEAGLRLEQSIYNGKLPSKGINYTNRYVSLFPSIFLSQKVSKNQEFQINYSRRIRRPDFWQLIPYTDYTDPQNQRKGNANLKPEFTNSFEFNYSDQFLTGDFLASIYYHNTDNSITNVFIPISGDTLLTTFANANTTNTYGLELTLQNNITKWWNLMTNFNLFNSVIHAGNIQGDLKDQGYSISSNLNNSGYSWFAKINSTMSLPAHFTLQISGDYRAPRPTPQGTIQGFGGMDMAVKKDFLKNRAASLTLSLSDVFNTRRFEERLTQGLVIQDNLRWRESRILRLNFMYRFGKFENQLFKKKNSSSQDNQPNMNQELGTPGGGGN